MKFSTLSLAALFAVANANDALHLRNGQFSWGYSATFEGASGDLNTPECIDAFNAAYVDSYNEINAGGDVHAESCEVTSVSPATKAGMLGGGYNYNGNGDYSCVRCKPNLASALTVMEVVNRLTSGGDLESVLKDKLKASSSCPAFASLSSVSITYSPTAVASVAPRLADDAKTFKWGYQAAFAGLGDGADSEACKNLFDDSFVDAYNEVNAGGDVHAESCEVDSVAPTFSDNTPALRATELRGYNYNGNGDYSCTRCKPEFFGLGAGDFDSTLKSKLVAGGDVCPAFASLTGVSVTFIPVSVVAAPVVKQSTFKWGFTASFAGVTGDAYSSDCINAFDAAFVNAYNEANAGSDVTAIDAHVDSAATGTLFAGTNMVQGYNYNGNGDYSCVRCKPGFAMDLSAKSIVKAIASDDMDTILAKKLKGACPAFDNLKSVAITFVPNYEAVDLEANIHA